jgi:hypothetical protein
MAIQYINNFQSKAMQNLPKLGFLAWKPTIWQPCFWCEANKSLATLLYQSRVCRPVKKVLEPILRKRFTAPPLKNYNTTSSLVRLENFFTFTMKNDLAYYVLRCRCSLKFRSRRIGSCLADTKNTQHIIKVVFLNRSSKDEIRPNWKLSNWIEKHFKHLQPCNLILYLFEVDILIGSTLDFTMTTNNNTHAHIFNRSY